MIAALLKGMESGIGAVIASVVWDMGAGVIRQKSLFSALILIGSFLACTVFHVNVVFVILAAGALGVARTLWIQKRRARK